MQFNTAPHSCASVQQFYFYFLIELLELVKDRAWLVKVTNAVNQHWQKRNAVKKNRPADGLPKGHSSSEPI
ncbi:MAG: hypothetical protein ACLPYZ_11795 [Limisphaerales bacterium]